MHRTYNNTHTYPQHSQELDIISEKFSKEFIEIEDFETLDNFLKLIKEKLPKFTQILLNRFLAASTLNGNLKQIEYLLKEGADIEGEDRILGSKNQNEELRKEKINIPLIIATKAGHEKVVKFLLEKGANVNSQTNKQAPNALMQAAYIGNLNIVKILIEQGKASISYKNSFKETALTYACTNGHLEVVKYLVQEHKKINDAEQLKELDGVLALRKACYNEHLSIVQFLLEQKAGHRSLEHNTYRAIQLAAQENKLEVAEFLTRILNTQNTDNLQNLFQEAIEHNQPKVIHFLCENAPKLGILDFKFNEGLLKASALNYSDIVYLLLKHAELNTTDLDGQTALHLVARNGNLELVKTLVTYGADLYRVCSESMEESEMEESENCNPMMLAFKYNNFDVGEYLSAKMRENPRIALPDISDSERALSLFKEKFFKIDQLEDLEKFWLKSQDTENLESLRDDLLIDAIERDDFEKTRFLLNHQADVDGKKIVLNPSTFMETSKLKSLVFLHSIPKRGPDFSRHVPNHKWNSNESLPQRPKIPLVCATEKGNAQIVELLIKNKANVENRSQDGALTALMTAAIYGRLDLAMILVGKGQANVNTANSLGTTALTCAARNGYTPLVAWLLTQGANIQQETHYKETALSLACEEGHIEVVKVLLDAKATIEHKNYDDETPLILAEQKGHTEVVKVLLEAGANDPAQDKTGYEPRNSASSFQRHNRQEAQLNPIIHKQKNPTSILFSSQSPTGSPPGQSDKNEDNDSSYRPIKIRV